MMECLGMSTAFSILLSRFEKFPKTCYYGNACMGRSIILRVPWVNDEYNVIYDRFDYKGHIFNSVWDPDSYYSCSSHANFVAESIDSLWALTKAHLGYLNPNNLIPFFIIRAVYISIRSMMQQEKGRQDINDIEFFDFVREKWSCD